MPCASIVDGTPTPVQLPVPFLWALALLPNLAYTSLQPSLALAVSKIDLVFSHLCCFTPTALCLEQNFSQPVTKARVSFTSKTSLCPLLRVSPCPAPTTWNQSSPETPSSCTVWLTGCMLYLVGVKFYSIYCLDLTHSVLIEHFHH